LIRIHILGSSAGGGLPQWNCACFNCVAARTGKIAPQTQSSIAITSDSFDGCFLINASPDLVRQIEAVPQLQPRGSSTGGSRNTPIAAIFLTNADIDHALGLLLLREQDTPIVVYASEETKTSLTWIDRVLAKFPGIEWRKISPEFHSLNGEITFRTIQLPGSVAFQFRDAASGATALFAPSVGEMTSELRGAVQDSTVVIFDGTFWNDGELAAVRAGARSAREMNHLPICDGPACNAALPETLRVCDAGAVALRAGSLDVLRRSPARRKIYTHINNTNPILMPGSPERVQLEQAGIEVARDGLEIVL
jgi:pyrroloquinoline quinone biosynthesis protein B